MHAGSGSSDGLCIAGVHMVVRCCKQEHAMATLGGQPGLMRRPHHRRALVDVGICGGVFLRNNHAWRPHGLSSMCCGRCSFLPVKLRRQPVSPVEAGCARQHVRQLVSLSTTRAGCNIRAR